MQPNILTDYTADSGTYSSRKTLQKSGFVPLDGNRQFYAKVDGDHYLEIWRTMADDLFDEDYPCVPVYTSQDWSPDEQYTQPFNKQIEELFKSTQH